MSMNCFGGILPARIILLLNVATMWGSENFLLWLMREWMVRFELSTLLGYFGFLSKYVDEPIDLLKWEARYTMSSKRLVVPLGYTFPMCVLSMIDVFMRNNLRFLMPLALASLNMFFMFFYYYQHDTNSSAHYARLKSRIENSRESAFNSMEHMMGNMFN